MQERFVVVAGVSPAILPAARLSCATRPYPASRILDATQIRRLIAFSSAVADVTIQRFHGAPACSVYPPWWAKTFGVAAREGGTNHDSNPKFSARECFRSFDATPVFSFGVRFAYRCSRR
jgi:hypothetical protein